MTHIQKVQPLPDVIVQNGTAYYKDTKKPYVYSGGVSAQYDKVDEQYENLPVIECKEAHISFIRVFFGLVFGAGFLAPVIAIASLSDIGHMSMTINGEYVEDAGILGYLFILPFFLVGVIALITAVSPFIKHLFLMIFGENIEGTVIGYEGDNLYINGRQAYCMMIKIQTDNEDAIIRYQTGKVTMQYPKNTVITLKKRGNMMYIVKEK